MGNDASAGSTWTNLFSRLHNGAVNPDSALAKVTAPDPDIVREVSRRSLISNPEYLVENS